MEMSKNYQLHTPTIAPGHWHITIFKFVLLVVVNSIPITEASSVVTLSSFKPPAWLQKDGIKSELNRGDQFEIGDQIITGSSAGVELHLGADFFIQVNENSEVIYLAGKTIETSPQSGLVELFVEKGMVCIHSDLEFNTDYKLVFNVGGTLQATLQHAGNICIERTNDTSSVFLWNGSGIIEHSITKETIVLSEAGTEFRSEDDGEYQFLAFGTGDAVIAESKEPPILEQVTENNILPAEVPKPVETKTTNNLPDNDIKPEISSEFEYTVYLFSTRSGEIAEKTNKKFQKAGYKTQIYEYRADEVTRYRIAMSGFETRQDANEFSQSIVGQLGIRDTWIGKAQRE